MPYRPDFVPPISKLLWVGRPASRIDKLPDLVDRYGFTAEHIPELIRLATSPELLGSLDDEGEEWVAGVNFYGPIYAWAVLGQMRAEAAILPILDICGDRFDNDWITEEVAQMYAMIGPVAIPALTAALADGQRDTSARIMYCSSLEEIANAHPEVRDQIVGIVSEQLTHADANDPELNGFLVATLLRF